MLAGAMTRSRSSFGGAPWDRWGRLLLPSPPGSPTAVRSCPSPGTMQCACSQYGCKSKPSPPVAGRPPGEPRCDTAEDGRRCDLDVPG
eukprot:15168039-Alexandrium_andersonii.AAC.1